jgi:hypothetical protein
VRFAVAVIALIAILEPAPSRLTEIERESARAETTRWPAPAVGRYERPRVGLSVVVPTGWSVVRKPMSNCSDPVQRIALRGQGAVVQIVESLSGSVSEFPARPRRFALRGKRQFLPCCPPAEGKGWFIPFHAAGRGFYAYVYLGAPETRAHALLVLDSLRIGARR